MSSDGQSTSKWYVLILTALSYTFAIAVPVSCMPVLFKEISEDLGLSVVEIGAVWGISPLAGVFLTLIGGLLGDRFGAKLTLSAGCLIVGLAGALRGLSGEFMGLMATMFLFGFFIAIIPVNVHKATSIWFQGRNLGMANGVVSTGMGIGFTLGAMISATVMSPLLGGWRNVLFLYGAITIALGFVWFITVREPARMESVVSGSSLAPLRQALLRLIRIRAVWLLGLILIGRVGCIIGLEGYLPFYLREKGWTPASADGTLAAFNGVSTMAAIPLAFLSDRLGLRKVILIPAMLSAVIGVGLLSLVDGAMVWILVILVGISVDGFMAVFITMVMETEGVGAKYAGTALGLVFTISRLGAFLSPPLGNSLAHIHPGLPFVFWAALSLLALFGFFFVKEVRHKKRETPSPGSTTTR